MARSGKFVNENRLCFSEIAQIHIETLNLMTHWQGKEYHLSETLPIERGCFLKALVGTQQRPDIEMAVEVELEGSSTCSKEAVSLARGRGRGHPLQEQRKKKNGGRPPSPTSLFLRSRLGEKKCKELESTLQVHDESSDDPAQTTRPITCNDIDAIEFRDEKSSNVLKNYLELRNNSEYDSVPDDLLFQQVSGLTSHHKPYGLGNTSMKQRESTLRGRSTIYVGPDRSSNTRDTGKMYSSEEVDEIVRAATLASNMDFEKKLASMNNEIMDRVATEINQFYKTAGIPRINLSEDATTSHPADHADSAENADNANNEFFNNNSWCYGNNQNNWY